MPKAKYDKWITPDGCTQIRAWVKDGLSDAAIAGKMGIDKTLLSKWRRCHKPIKDALIRPMQTADGEIVDKHDAYEQNPRKLNNVESVQIKIDKWLEDCKENNKPLLKTDLALALGIGKEALYRYERETDRRGAEPISDPVTGEVHLVTVGDLIKRAALAIESDLAKRAINNSAGAIFMLKNWYGYADKKDVGVVQGSTASAAERSMTNDQIEDKIRFLLEKANEKPL